MSSLTSRFNNLRLQVNPKAASGFCPGSNHTSDIVNAGVNGIFPSVYYPEIVRNAIECAVPGENLASTLDVVKSGLFFTIYCVKVAETSKSDGRSVDQTLSSLFSQFFKTGFTNENQANKFTLKDLNADNGLATAVSKPDFVHTTTLKDNSRFGLAVMEFKDTAQAPLEQMGQAFVIGCNVILSHLSLGLDWSKCAVPLVLTNGNLYQFAWVTLLEPSFPVLNVTTGVLDASVPYTRKEIAENLVRIKLFCASAEERIRLCCSKFEPKSKSKDGFIVELDAMKYHRKPFKDTFLRWDDRNEESLGYLWQIYQHLALVAEAVLPLGFANLKKVDAETSEECIIFPKLEKEFTMDVPGDKDLYSLYFVPLRQTRSRASLRRPRSLGIAAAF